MVMNVGQEIVGKIDERLGLCAERELFSSDEEADFLLDLRILALQLEAEALVTA